MKIFIISLTVNTDVCRINERQNGCHIFLHMELLLQMSPTLKPLSLSTIPSCYD